MAVSSKNIIRERKLDLIEWLRPSRVLILNHVHSKSIITDAEYTRLNSIQDPEEANGKLIDKVYDKGEKTCAEFLSALEDSRIKETYPELAVWIASLEGTFSKGGRDKVDTGIQISDKCQFFKKKRRSLVEKVKNTMSILDFLKEEGFHSEKASQVAAEKTEEARMRMILDSITTKSMAENLFKALKVYEEDVLTELIETYQN